MTTWLRTGTPTFTDNSTTVTFTGVDLIASNVNAGDAIHAPDGEVYEIASVDSATQLTLTQPYRLRTGYAIQPTRGIVAKLRDALQAQISQVESYLSGPLIGRFNGGSAAQPGVSRNTDQDTGLAWLSSNKLSMVAGGQEAFSVTASEASGGAVQSSATDDTAGKLMKVGGFGLGGQIDYVSVDLDVVPYGFGANSGVANYPLNNPTGTAANSRWSWATFGNTNAALQIAHRNDVKDGPYVRASTVGSWRDWEKILTRESDILGTVSQSGGVPTGAIVEEGSNAQGDFTKFASGLMICRRKLSYTGMTSAVQGNGYTNGTGFGSISWPATFVERPVCAGSVENSASILVGFYQANANTYSPRVLSFNAIPGDFDMNVSAIGKWF